MVKVVWQIGGAAGYGIKSTGTMLAKVASRSGYGVFGYTEYPSLIRGGHNVYQVAISNKENGTASEFIDVLVCLDKETFYTHQNDLNKNGVVIFDPNDFEIKAERGDLRLYSVPFSELAMKSGGSKIHSNMVALGASLSLIDLDLGVLNSLLETEFKRKGKEVISINKKAALAGFEYINKNFTLKIDHKLEKKTKKSQMYISGNEAMALGAIAGGCRFFTAYPMTPSTAILLYMCKKERELGMIVKQMESEVAVINTAIGAAWAGARSFCATSGGGFCLMTEGLGLAAMSETPVVVANVMRPGPSTGLPTWTEQGDLNFVLNASHGEFPRFVLAPGDVKESFELTALAFNLAEKYQMPVILLSDKYLAESYFSENKFPANFSIDRGKLLTRKELAKIENYKRYEDLEDGISKRTIPGMKGGVHLANSDEHQENGFSTEDSEIRIQQMDKRFRKFENALKDVPGIKVFGEKKADLTLVGWGSTKGVILEVLEELKSKGRNVNFIQVISMSPFPSDEIKKMLSRSKSIYVIENNKTGQLADLIQSNTGIKAKKILKYDGRPFYKSEIIKHMRLL